MIRRAVFLTATAAVALTFGTLPADALMPVFGTSQVANRSDIVLVQDQTAPKKSTKKTARQKEIDQSVESGTVPKRYKSSVPKQYHHLIPFAK
jgi:hypothetical protein